MSEANTGTLAVAASPAFVGVVQRGDFEDVPGYWHEAADYLAQTDDEVTVTQPGSRLTGRGFETNLKTKEYTFKSQVRSIYEPRSAR